MTRSRLLTIVLSSGLLLAILVFAGKVVPSVHLPGNNQGYEPVQPMQYSHRLHAGDMGIDCRYCHFGAERSKTAGVPPVNVCLNCHGFVSASQSVMRAENESAGKEGRTPRRIVSEALRPLYAAAGWNVDLQRDTSLTPRAIKWIRVHNLPDFVYFDHRPHLNSGLQCQQCHGEVQTMERIRQVSDLSMGWCVNCHRQANENGINGHSVSAPLDCSACHY